MGYNTAALINKSLFLSSAVKFPRRHFSQLCNQSQVPATPIQTSGIRSFLCHGHTYPSKPCHGVVFKELGGSGLGFGRLGYDHLRVSALANDDGSGGNGGSGSWNAGGGGQGSSGDETGGGGEKLSLLSWYLALLGKYPVYVKALTSAFLTLIGDLICQLVIEQVPSLDLKRTFIFSLLGFVLVGPILHFCKLVTMPGASGSFLRLVLDQFLFSPTFLGVFLATLVTLEGKPSQVVPKLQQEWSSAVLANWQLWIPFQFLNFRYVPQQFQVLAANVIALVWNVILSFKAHKEVLQK